MQSDSRNAADRVHRRRLLRVPTDKLAPADRETLLAHFRQADLEGCLEVIHAHGALDAAPRMIEVLAERISTDLNVLQAEDIARLVVCRLGADAHADLVTRVAPRLLAVGSDQAVASTRTFLRFLRGGPRFDRVNAADLDQPDFGDGGKPIGLSVAVADVRYDEDAVVGILVERALLGGPHALRAWSVARSARDDALERAVRPVALAQLDLALAPEAAPAWHERLLGGVIGWLGEDGDSVERAEAVLGRARDAHARGEAWGAILFRLFSVGGPVRQQLLELSLDEDDAPVHDAHSALREPLAAGSELAWRRFFRWVTRGCLASPIAVRSLLRAGTLPDSPDDEFWTAYLAAWEEVRAQEKVLLDQLERAAAPHLPPDLHPMIREASLKKFDPRLFPLVSPGEVMDKILDRPPTPVTAAAVLEALVEVPSRLGDPRIARFAAFVQHLPHERLPRADNLELSDDGVVQNFLAIHAECGAAHLREHVREFLAAEPRPRTGWLLERPWLESILEDALRSELCTRVLGEPWRELVRYAEHQPNWVGHDDVIARAPASLSECGPLDRLPAWLDRLLIDLARATRSRSELASIAARFVNHAELRGAVFEILRDRLRDGTVDGAAGLVGDMLETRAAWEKLAPDIVFELLHADRPSELKQLVFGSVPLQLAERASDKKRIVAMHLAFAQGVLRWATERARAGDSGTVERALIAIGLLDPPPPFTRDLRAFEKLDLDESARHWVQRIHGAIETAGGRDADFSALCECINELCGRGEA